MNACVNDDACIGCGLCTNIAPAVFELNDVGKAYALDTAEETAAPCRRPSTPAPPRAISWTD